MAKKDRISELVRFLSGEGQKIVDSQLQNKGYTHRTHNLHDSYGWGVYVDKKLVASGFPAVKAGSGMVKRLKVVKPLPISYKTSTRHMTG